MRKVIAIFFVMLCAFSRAQLIQDTSKNVHYLILPAVFRSPETGWAGGLSGNISFKTSFKNDPLTRTSTINALGLWTERKQNIQGIFANIFFPKENYILNFQGSHSYFPDKFWGIGPDTKNEWREKYVFEQFYLYAHLKRKLTRKFFVGGVCEYQNVFKVSYDDGGVFDTSNFSGKTPYAVSGLGLSMSYDSRNVAFWPTKGLFIQSYYTVFDKSFGSAYNFNKWVMDIRYFQTLYKQHIIAIQYYSYITSGQPPLRNLGTLGGENSLRGFYQGRFRDKNMMSAVAEYRTVIYKRLGAVIFGGVGSVYSDPKELPNTHFKYSFGGGLRFSMLEKERLNIRFDYGYYDNYNSGFYFTIGESF